jgi:carbonic anhydrase
VSAIADLVRANAGYASRFPGERPASPRLGVAVVACMDARVDLFAALGLDLGDAHVIRNAGGRVTDDVLRSLAISQRELGTKEIMLIHHTQCGLAGFDDAAFRARLSADSGRPPTWDVPGFADPAAGALESAQRVRACAWLPHRDSVRAFVFDVATGRLAEA